MKNEVILLTPAKTFLSYYLNSDQTKTTASAGTNVNLKIDLPEQGVYILEVNTEAGEALINTPIYVG